MKSESENLMGADTGKATTRRSAIRTAGQAAAFAGLTLTARSASAQSIYSKRSVTAFALAGDRYHNIGFHCEVRIWQHCGRAQSITR
jgi:hypothetical protein